MDYAELLKLIVEANPNSGKIISILSDNNYEVNPPQMEKFESVVRYLKALTDRQMGSIATIALKPSEKHGTVTATFDFLDLADKLDVARFCTTLMSCCDAVDFLGNKSGKFEISCTVRDVFIPKGNN